MAVGLARVEAAAGSVADRVGPVEVAAILGSGLGGLAEGLHEATEVAYADIEGFPVPTAPGHAGRLLSGRLYGRRVALLEGRLHLYEGWRPEDVAMPVYLARALGARALVLTNAAGGLNPEFRPGEAMLIDDHLNLTGANPLTGANDDALGLRFPDLSRVWDPELRQRAVAAAEAAGVGLQRGVYVGVAGPSLETSAERRFLRMAGGDAVGMSTVIEAIAAAHAGLRLVGFSAISNAATGGPEQQPDTVESVLAMAAVAGETIAAVLARLLPDV